MIRQPFRRRRAKQEQAAPAELLHRSSQLRCPAIFLSDLHLGSQLCEADGLLHFLGQIRPDLLVLVGDVLDLQAIRHHAGCDPLDLDRALLRVFTEPGPLHLFAGLRRELKAWLPERHQQVLSRLGRLIELGVEVVLIPGNHDASLRRFCPLHGPGWTLRHELLYSAPDGRRMLAVHGDEDDGVVGLHDGLVQALVSTQETYTALAAGLRRLSAPLAGPQPLLVGAASGQLMNDAAELLAGHWHRAGCSRPPLDRHGLSPAFTLERLMKRGLGHDRRLKRRLLQRLQKTPWPDQVLEGVMGVDAVIAGHTHIPEATAFALPGADGPPQTLRAGAGSRRPSRCRCHIEYYNDGSWARGQKRLGRTALVVANDGAIGMVQQERSGRIVAFQPPRFAFNTYPMQPCRGFGVMVATP